MGVEAAREPIVEDIVNLFVCMVFLIARCLDEMLVLTGRGLRVLSLILEAAERTAA